MTELVVGQEIMVKTETGWRAGVVHADYPAPSVVDHYVDVRQGDRVRPWPRLWVRLPDEIMGEVLLS